MDKLEPKDWWEYYIDGKMIRRDDTPMSIIRTLEDWAEHTLTPKDDVMWQFAQGKPVSPGKLQLAITECVSSNTLEKEQKKLKALEVWAWAIREAALAEAAKSLREARETFGHAVHAAGLNWHHAYKIASAADALQQSDNELSETKKSGYSA